VWYAEDVGLVINEGYVCIYAKEDGTRLKDSTTYVQATHPSI
jgi:hypothetical protein